MGAYPQNSLPFRDLAAPRLSQPPTEQFSIVGHLFQNILKPLPIHISLDCIPIGGYKKQGSFIVNGQNGVRFALCCKEEKEIEDDILSYLISNLRFKIENSRAHERGYRYN